jgi:hypothetical protein
LEQQSKRHWKVLPNVMKQSKKKMLSPELNTTELDAGVINIRT